MPKENRLIAPRRYILLIAAIVAIFVFAAAHRDYFESSKVEFSHIRSFKKPNNQPTYLVLYNYLFEEENGNAIDFNLYGHQLRFYKTAQMSFQNAKVSGIITSKHIQMSIWLKKIDKMLFPWLKPQFPSTLALKESYVGSGIVICVSNNYIQSAMTTIAMIRVNSDMPIEFLYLSPSDLSEENIKLLESADHVKAKSIKTYFDTKTINIKGWEIKPFALLASSFKKAILIDARTVLLQPPENFFNNPMFLKTGALFFKERTVKSSDSKSAKKINSIVEKLLPKPISEDVTNMQILNRLSSHQQDSGVVVVDKDRVFAGLMATAFLNIDQTRQELSKYLIENKETFVGIY